ncbi:hypothetical protein [Beijerinckia indica]|uniref:Uncharacterized protein n=1 Tax=Beijerinckia indica subsp. indica (strain ATCC 9039 / DSM 1715 / NCIMB 8712) TaxID=395963 RepID=B2ILF5_BEII9|nr:hypothetical protein [Beijerinckia indica]ACB97355.1 hypothetical protein Bind_3815 [Beijerinckia indica subsp. indica ATCC 9039]
MARISLLSTYRNGVVKLVDRSAFQIAPDQIHKTADWTQGTELIVQEVQGDDVWTYRLIASCRGIPVKAKPYDGESLPVNQPRAEQQPSVLAANP